MPNTYQKIFLHAVFAVKYRKALLHMSWRYKLFQYISGVVKQRGHFCYAVNGYNDHIHIFFDYKEHELISDLIREIKKASTTYINDKKLTPSKFQWQSGNGTCRPPGRIFSHGYHTKGILINYIKNQEEHHKRKSFKKEYLHLLESYEIEFKDEYLFDFVE